MKVVYLASEVVPFAKTGGLADVAGTLPKSLQKSGVDIAVFMPLYKMVKEGRHSLTKMNIRYKVKIGDTLKPGGVYKGFLPDTQVPVYFLENEQYFDRTGLYTYPGTTREYEDNCERFIYFTKGVLEVIEKLGMYPEIVHCNDWHTGLVPVYLKTTYAGKECFKHTKTIMTIHNLSYQGLFPPWYMNIAGLNWGLFNWKELEFYGNLNFLKGGIVFSDLITTVSRVYAQEIQTAEYGVGLEGVLRERARDLYGIINGIDYAEWNPETDKFIVANYGINDLTGKQICKRVLQRKYSLPERDVPLIGIVSRLTNQKGLDVIAEKFNDLMKLNIQFVLLGTGEPKYHEVFQSYSKIYQKKAAVTFTFDERLAHEIEAGSDMFLMPSHFEPCGLSQLYSLKYGTVPIVRSTGGLADTIIDYRSGDIENGRVNGFLFKGDGDILLATIIRAIDIFKNKKQWLRIMKNGMSQDWSLEKSAKEYHRLYKDLVKAA
ncbi:MAG: glycogen synthase GlgA [Candidatus Brocadiaceae bacterium]|nr:glycogen synthase GlgA [Candidatus Brocadiaceae bacterium]